MNSPIELSAERALQIMREVVAEYGEDHVYTTPDGTPADGMSSCFYVHDDQPGCIAGHVFHRAGISLQTLRDAESSGANGVAHKLGIPAETGATLYQAQLTQDDGGTWGEALAEAERYAAEQSDVH